ncbi:MAG: nitrogen fixation protein NifH, partial [Actinobacteria bacterium]|nr:nitrogen fixation protein NifH [Actinomycetota bacterium]
MTDSRRRSLKADPLPWLLEESDPAVRAATLTRLLRRPDSDPDAVAARAAAMRSDPIKGILDAMDPRGFWVKPGPGYAPKYTGTVWNLMFLEQLGADPADERVQAACRYVLDHTTVATGGFGCSGSHLERNPPPSSVLHCLNG